ncbi:hypothetical protein ABIA33_003653 [Streptacidiphilus sp. MAP12-16]|uniref:hypothetical protein n=1 Tax=Streptacidiphilus sp. MAP12-16 TaxID=3156300 RepID=UPI003511D861
MATVRAAGGSSTVPSLIGMEDLPHRANNNTVLPELVELLCGRWAVRQVSRDLCYRRAVVISASSASISANCLPSSSAAGHAESEGFEPSVTVPRHDSFQDGVGVRGRTCSHLHAG